MARDRNKRLMIVIALIAVVSITIGFAAVSSSLLIKTSLSVNPTSENFSVIFSTSSTEALEGTVEPTVVPDTLEAADATITNDGTFPTISGIDVVFTEPGQSVTYSFYALNNGKYDAYLTSIVLQSLTSGSFKECIPGEGATTESVNNACNSIDVRVSAGDLEVSSTTLGIENHQLLIGKSEAVTITIEYREDGSIADGPVEVNFGNIYLTYGTQMTDEMPIFPEPGVTICKAVDSSKAGSTTLGTEYACQVSDTESHNFYVLSTNGDNVNLLMSTNLGEEVYSASVTEENYDGSRPSYLTEVETLTKNWNNLTNYDEEYTDKWNLYTTKLTGKARLPKYDEIAALCPYEGKDNYVDCNEDDYSNWCEEHSTGIYRYGCLDWIVSDDDTIEDSYWTMDFYLQAHLAGWAVHGGYKTLDDFASELSMGDQKYFGIRPVITVTTSDLS